MMQKGIGSFLEGGGTTGGGGLKSALSGLGGLNHDHALVQHVQQNAAIQDPDQASQYTQHGVNLLKEQADSNPQGIQSVLAGFLGGGSSSQQQHQQQQKNGGTGVGGGIGDMLGI